MNIQRYVALGDSLTEGFSDWGRADRSIGFASVLANVLREAQNDLEFTNLGVSGARTADVLHYQAERGLGLRPDLLTLVVGANDVPGTPLEGFRRDYRELIARLAKGISGLLLIANLPNFAHLLPVPYASYRNILVERVSSFNQIIAESAAAHGAILVDLFSSPAAEDPRNLSGDGVHPNARGYRIMAGAFVQALNTTGLSLRSPTVDP